MSSLFIRLYLSSSSGFSFMRSGAGIFSSWLNLIILYLITTTYLTADEMENQVRYI